MNLCVIISRKSSFIAYLQLHIIFVFKLSIGKLDITIKVCASDI